MHSESLPYPSPVSEAAVLDVRSILPQLQLSIEKHDPLMAIAAMEHIGRYCVSRSNTDQHIDDLLPCVSEDFRAEVDNFPATNSMLDYWATHTRELNGALMKLVDLATHMDWPEKRADVLMSFEVHGRPEGLVRDSLVVMKWKVVAGRWVWFHVVSMRSGGANSADGNLSK